MAARQQGRRRKLRGDAERHGMATVYSVELMASAGASASIRTGVWAVIYLQPPGRRSQPAGVVLWDPIDDALHLAKRDLGDHELEEDLLAFWDELDGFLDAVSADIGGMKTLSWLQSDCSHVVQLGSWTSATITDVEGLLTSLFHSLVLAPQAEFTISPQRIRTIEDRVPLLPSAAIQTLAVLNDSQASLSQVESAIARDPAIASQIVRLANSGSIHLRDGPARSLRSALQRIGFDSARVVVLGLTVGKMYAAPRLRPLWHHAVEAAQVARRLAQTIGRSAEEAALAALVHDIGRIILFNFGDQFEFEYDRLLAYGLPACYVEAQICGISHCELGADLLQKWSFPADLCEAVRYHHAPSGTASPFAALLHLADSGLAINEDCWLISEQAIARQRLGLATAAEIPDAAQLDLDLQFLRAMA